MRCEAINAMLAEKISIWARLMAFAVQALSKDGGAGVGPVSARVDLDELPDRVKRDLGFLDGREPYYEDDGRTR